MKMPEPTMPPITSMTASKRPRRRRRLGISLFKHDGCFGPGSSPDGPIYNRSAGCQPALHFFAAIFNRPCAGPLEYFWCCYQAGPHWIHLDVRGYAIEFLRIANQTIVAFVLPERAPGSSEHTVGFPRGESL